MHVATERAADCRQTGLNHHNPRLPISQQLQKGMEAQMYAGSIGHSVTITATGKIQLLMLVPLFADMQQKTEGVGYTGPPVHSLRRNKAVVIGMLSR